MSLFRRKKPAAPGADAVAPATSGAMLLGISGESLSGETRDLITAIASRMRNPVDSAIGDAVETAPRQASDGVRKLVDTLHRKMLPLKFDTKPVSVDSTVLAKALKKQLQTLPAPTLETITPFEAPAAPGLSLPDAQPDTPADDEPAREIKPEEQLNPFSLINIKRGSSKGMVMTASETGTTGAAAGARKDQVGVERSTVSYRKRLAQSKFSRRRYLRDYRGTNLLSMIFLLITLIAFNAGTVLTNVSYLIPQTALNQDAGQQSQTFANDISRDQPKLASLIKRRQSINKKVDEALDAFQPVTKIREDFGNFLAVLDEHPMIKLNKQEINETASELPKISVISVNIEIETSFLVWLKVRNDIVRQIGSINITDEQIVAPPGVSTINVSMVMSKTGRTE